MEINVIAKDRLIILELHGALLGGATKILREAMTEYSHASKEECPAILWDLQDVDGIDSMGLGLLIFYVKECSPKGKTFALCNISDIVKGALKITGMDRVLEVYESKASALNSIKEKE